MSLYQQVQVSRLLFKSWNHIQHFLLHWRWVTFFHLKTQGFPLVFSRRRRRGEGPNGECCRLLSTLTSSLRNEMGGAKRPGPGGPGGHFHGDGVGWIWRCVWVFLMILIVFEKTQGIFGKTSHHNTILKSMFNKKMEGVELVTGLTGWTFWTPQILGRWWPVTTSSVRLQNDHFKLGD